MSEMIQPMDVSPQKDFKTSNNKPIRPLAAYSIFIGSALMFFVIGISIGKMFFWNNYDTTPVFEKQLSIAQQKVSSNPKNPQNHVDLGWAYFQKKDYNKALASYKKALELDKDYYPAYLNIGLTNMQLEKWDVAVESLKKASQINPKSSPAHANLGIALNKKGQFDEAIKHLEASEKLSPGSVGVILNIALAYEGKGQIDDALYHLNGALQYDPSNKDLQKELKRLEAKKAK